MSLYNLLTLLFQLPFHRLERARPAGPRSLAPQRLHLPHKQCRAPPTRHVTADLPPAWAAPQSQSRKGFNLFQVNSSPQPLPPRHHTLQIPATPTTYQLLKPPGAHPSVRMPPLAGQAPTQFLPLPHYAHFFPPPPVPGADICVRMPPQMATITIAHQRQKNKLMFRATESEILQQFEKTYTDPNMQDNSVAELEHVECPSVALESARPVDSESDDSDAEAPTSELVTSLRFWASSFSVSLAALTALLIILRVFHPELPRDVRTILKTQVFEIPCLKKINKWCVVQFSSGATEIVPNTWVEGGKVFWPPYPTKDSIRMNAAVLNREQSGHGWHTYQPIRLLITRDSHDEAARSLDRYVNKDCDTTDIQSEEESHHGLKRKRRPNPIYHSDEEPRNECRFAQAPKVLFPDVAMQKLLTAVTELSKEVKDLREEFRLFRQSCRCGQSDCVGLPLAEPLEVPLHTMEALDRAEETLQNGTNRQTMVVV
ncbi:unnamed protein product [Leuciscus chuanchicus]